MTELVEYLKKIRNEIQTYDLNKLEQCVDRLA